MVGGLLARDRVKLFPRSADYNAKRWGPFHVSRTNIWYKSFLSAYEVDAKLGSITPVRSI